MNDPAFAFPQIHVPALPAKPRAQGVTSILDKGMGPAQVADLCAVAGHWIDVCKFGWGTARIRGC